MRLALFSVCGVYKTCSIMATIVPTIQLEASQINRLILKLLSNRLDWALSPSGVDMRTRTFSFIVPALILLYHLYHNAYP